MLQEIDMAAVTQFCEQPQSVLPVEQEPPFPVQPEKTDLEIPNGIWLTMFACYVVFFGALLAATGRETGAVFMIVISALYAVVYFGVASVLFTQNKPANPSLFAKGIGPLITSTGPMSKGSVAGQILTIPLCLALFAIAIAIYRSMIFG